MQHQMKLKRVVRSWTARRVRVAFRRALRERGFDGEGRWVGVLPRREREEQQQGVLGGEGGGVSAHMDAGPGSGPGPGPGLGTGTSTVSGAGAGASTSASASTDSNSNSNSDSTTDPGNLNGNAEIFVSPGSIKERFGRIQEEADSLVDALIRRRSQYYRQRGRNM